MILPSRKELIFLASVRTRLSRENKFNPLMVLLRKAILPWRIRHIHGPSKISLGDDELVVTCLCRDGGYFIPSFLEHHRKLGVKHFFFLDNGSKDNSMHQLQTEGDVTIYSTKARYATNENILKTWLVRRHCPKSWCLHLDIDELFVHPLFERMTLAKLLQYLNGRGFNAVVTQMIDMYRREPVFETRDKMDLRQAVQGNIRAAYQYFDTSCITDAPYCFADIPNKRIKFRHGGTRKRLYGTNVGLTKVSLFKMGRKMNIFVQWHHVSRNARVADISCALLHYPYTYDFFDKVRASASERRYGYLVNDEYDKYLTAINKGRQISPFIQSSVKMNSDEDLIKHGVIHVSEDYIRFSMLCQEK
jgi:hypothetical protein